MPLNPLQGLDIVLKVTKGVDRGAKYQMLSSRVFIGRSEDCDIVLTDPKVSRNHALLEYNNNGLIVQNLSTSNKLLLNGQEVNQAFVSFGSVIQIGLTQIEVQEARQEFQAPSDDVYGAFPDTPKAKKNKTFFYLVLGILLLFGFLLSNESNVLEEEEEEVFRDEEVISQEIIDSEKRIQDLIQEQQVAGKNTKQYQDAQSAYLKGFRDYREGNYPRAISSFQAALALYPKHVLAAKYLTVSLRKLGEAVQFSMYEGKQSMEKGQYRQARAAFQNVMVLLKDPTNPTFREAKARANECDILLEGAY